MPPITTSQRLGRGALLLLIPGHCLDVTRKFLHVVQHVGPKGLAGLLLKNFSYLMQPVRALLRREDLDVLLHLDQRALDVLLHTLLGGESCTKASHVPLNLSLCLCLERYR